MDIDDEAAAEKPKSKRFDAFYTALRASLLTATVSAATNAAHPNPVQQRNEILSPIFASLGVSTNFSKASKARQSLDAKPHAPILGVLVAFENDE